MIRLKLLLLALTLQTIFCLGSSLPAANLIEPEPPKKVQRNDVTFITVDRGSFSGITTPERLVVRDENEWILLWRRHVQGQSDPPELKHINFDTDMVIAIFAGERGGSYAIQIDKIKKADDKLVVLVSEPSLEPSAIPMPGTVSTTRPFHIVRTAKTSASVVFQ